MAGTKVGKPKREVTKRQLSHYDTEVTTGGYWLLEVLDKEDNKQISDDDRNLLKANALDEWSFSLRDDLGNEVSSYLTDEMRAWAIEKAMGD